MPRLSLLITGVPGTGKTTLAKSLCKKTGAALIEINELAELLGLYSHTDPSDGAKVVRLQKLERELSLAIKAEKGSVVVDGHLGCEFPLPVQKVIVLRCEPSELRRRLAPRNYPQAKMAQNALAEALDYCTINAEKHYGRRRVFELYTTGKAPKQALAEAEKTILGKMKKKLRVSFPQALMREAISGEKIRKAFHE